MTVEDKGASIALHYRQAPDRARAIDAINSALDGLGVDLSVSGGKMVVNIVPARANDKAGALRSLVSRAGVDAAVFLGDDVNDEPVFEADEPGWLTICVGRELSNSRARYVLASPHDMPRLLDWMLAELGRVTA